MVYPDECTMCLEKEYVGCLCSINISETDLINWAVKVVRARRNVLSSYSIDY